MTQHIPSEEDMNKLLSLFSEINRDYKIVMRDGSPAMKAAAKKEYQEILDMIRYETADWIAEHKLDETELAKVIETAPQPFAEKIRDLQRAMTEMVGVFEKEGGGRRRSSLMRGKGRRRKKV